MTDEPRLQTQPRGGVPDVTDTLEGFREVCDRLAGAAGPLAADAERASGFRYGHEDWLVQFKREGAGIVLLDPVALTRAGADWGMFNDAVGDAVWILHDSLQDLPGFADIGLTPQALFDTEIAARMLGLHRFGLAAVTEHYLGVTLAKEHSAADWSYRPLPRDWRNYAALDVELLIELRRKMQRELKSQGKDGWADEEFRYALQTGMGPRREHPVPWLRISHINTVSQDHQGLAVAKALWEKRDELARAYDIAPGLLLSDDSIVEAASRKPRNAREFRMIRRAHAHRRRAGQDVRTVRADSAQGQALGMARDDSARAGAAAVAMAGDAGARGRRGACERTSLDEALGHQAPSAYAAAARRAQSRLPDRRRHPHPRRNHRQAADPAQPVLDRRTAQARCRGIPQIAGRP